MCMSWDTQNPLCPRPPRPDDPPPPPRSQTAAVLTEMRRLRARRMKLLRSRAWWLADVTAVYPRRFLLRLSALEVWRRRVPVSILLPLTDLLCVHAVVTCRDTSYT